MFETFSFLHCWTFVPELSMADHFMARERCTTDRHCPTKTLSVRGNWESDEIHIPAIHSRFMWLVLHSDMACGCTTNRHVDFERTAVAICIIWRVLFLQGNERSVSNIVELLRGTIDRIYFGPVNFCPNSYLGCIPPSRIDKTILSNHASLSAILCRPLPWQFLSCI